jgi:hypothetical protein
MSRPDADATGIKPYLVRYHLILITFVLLYLRCSPRGRVLAWPT